MAGTWQDANTTLREAIVLTGAAGAGLPESNHRTVLLLLRGGRPVRHELPGRDVNCDVIAPTCASGRKSMLDDIGHRQIGFLVVGPDTITRPAADPARLTEMHSVADLYDRLDEFKNELEAAGLKPNSVDTYVGRSKTFVDWMAGKYQPRGPNTAE